MCKANFLFCTPHTSPLSLSLLFHNMVFHILSLLLILACLSLCFSLLHIYVLALGARVMTDRVHVFSIFPLICQLADLKICSHLGNDTIHNIVLTGMILHNKYVTNISFTININIFIIKKVTVISGTTLIN